MAKEKHQQVRGDIEQAVRAIRANPGKWQELRSELASAKSDDDRVEHLIDLVTDEDRCDDQACGAHNGFYPGKPPVRGHGFIQPAQMSTGRNYREGQ